MLRKYLALLFVLCLIVPASPYTAQAASSDKPIQMAVNTKKITGVIPIVKSGVMYVPFRKLFEALGSKVSFDPESQLISGLINGEEIRFWIGEDVAEYGNDTYYLREAIPVINGQAYLPLHLFGIMAKYSIYYDKPGFTVNLVTYGYGQEAAIMELLTKYYETYSPRLLSSDNLALGYLNPINDDEAEKPISEVPVRDFKVTIDKIEYNSGSKAKLQVTYIKNTEVLNQEDICVYDITYEQGKWKILHEAWIFNRMELPGDIDDKAAVILKNHFSEQIAVLSDLRTYYNANNEENLELTTKYTDPYIINQWNKKASGSKTWENMTEKHFNLHESRYKLTNERVIFLGEKEAVVQGTLFWNDISYDDGKEGNTYEAIIYMKYANGHWTYNDDIDIDIDYDDREDVISR